MTETPSGDLQHVETYVPDDLQVDAADNVDDGIVETTGHARIDEALNRLEALDELDINEHPEQFDAIHQALRESLASAGRDGDATEHP